MMNFRVLTVLSLFVFFPYLVFAAEETVAGKSSEKVEKYFEIIDGTSQVAGEPGTDKKEARASWVTACDEWKKETKTLNKKNEVLSLSCSQADCSYQENGSYVCSSTATYKLKTEGRLAPPPVKAPVTKTETIVMQAPPQVVTEYAPAPQPGYIWVSGFWGWQGHRHVWFPGRWEAARVGHRWVGPEWRRERGGWIFRDGYWQ